MHLENPPFKRGETFFGASGTPDVAVGTHLEGLEFEFEDFDYSASGAKALRTRGQRVRCRIVRNVGTIALAPKRLVILEGSGVFGTRVDGYSRLTNARCYPVDEWLPAAGVAVNDLFYIVVKGPAVFTTALSTLAANIGVGDAVVAITAAASTSTTAGRGEAADWNVATTVLSGAVRNLVGTAMSAKTTGNTGQDILVDVGKW